MRKYIFASLLALIGSRSFALNSITISSPTDTLSKSLRSAWSNTNVSGVSIILPDALSLKESALEPFQPDEPNYNYDYNFKDPSEYLDPEFQKPKFEFHTEWIIKFDFDVPGKHIRIARNMVAKVYSTQHWIHVFAMKDGGSDANRFVRMYRWPGTKKVDKLFLSCEFDSLVLAVGPKDLVALQSTLPEIALEPILLEMLQFAGKLDGDSKKYISSNSVDNSIRKEIGFRPYKSLWTPDHPISKKIEVSIPDTLPFQGNLYNRVLEWAEKNPDVAYCFSEEDTPIVISTKKQNRAERALRQLKYDARKKLSSFKRPSVRVR